MNYEDNEKNGLKQLDLDELSDHILEQNTAENMGKTDPSAHRMKRNMHKTLGNFSMLFFIVFLLALVTVGIIFFPIT
ncbi:MAG: hypothetical protein GY765_17055 [bacterium]|nr:hypothetical protein [bacterium]